MTGITPRLTVAISPQILRDYPGTKVAFLLARIIVEPKASLKEHERFISDYKQKVVAVTKERGITSANYPSLRVCESWRKVFSTFDAGDDKKTTVENLLRRTTHQIDMIAGTTKKADLGKISNFVDVYNCVSIETLTPMGAIDLSKVEGGKIELRYGKDGEKFIPLGKEAVEHDVKSNHVVYGDEKNVVTWLWNYKDAAHSCVPKESSKGADGKPEPVYVLLFADQAEQDVDAMRKPITERPGDVELAIETAAAELVKIGADILFTDCLHSKRPVASFDLSRVEEDEVTVEPKVTLADCAAAGSGGASGGGHSEVAHSKE